MNSTTQSNDSSLDLLQLSFRPFSEEQPYEIEDRGVLPHWRQEGCTYFVTLRLADAVPASLMACWKYERDCWLVSRGINPHRDDWLKDFCKLNSQDRHLFEDLFLERLNDSLDLGFGSCRLRNARVSQLVAVTLEHDQFSRCEIGDYVVMPNHVHALITPYQDHDIDSILNSVKSHIVHVVNRKRLNEPDSHNHSASWNSRPVSGKPLWRKEHTVQIVRDIRHLRHLQECIRIEPYQCKLPAGEYQLKEARYRYE